MPWLRHEMIVYHPARLSTVAYLGAQGSKRLRITDASLRSFMQVNPMAQYFPAPNADTKQCLVHGLVLDEIPRVGC